MTQSPPKAAASSRPPSALSLDGGRFITAAAAGVSVLVLCVTAVVMWPRTYGAEATFALGAGATVENPIALAGKLEAALLEREVLATAAMDLPPELRSPDPIGKLRAGIHVQSRGGLNYAVEFRGSEPQSVQRITNRMVERAVALVPKLATSPDDAAPMIDLAAKTHAVTEFLTAHPEITLEQTGDKPSTSGDDAALELLRTERRVTEQRLANQATDNPYADANDDPEKLTRRLTELKATIARREAALKQPKAEAPPAVAPELQAQWRTLLSQMAAAQAKVAHPDTKPPVSARVTSKAQLPTSPLTPNRLILSIVAALLSLAAAMLGFVLPSKTRVVRQPRSDAPPRPAARAPEEGAVASPSPNEPRAKPPELMPAADPRSEPPAPPTGSEPPGPMAPMRPVVLSSSSAPPPRAEQPKRRATTPGGLEAPIDPTRPSQAPVPAPGGASASMAGPLFGSRPPPGAGSYSVSSSHPPPFEGAGSTVRTSVERLSPLQSQRPPAAVIQTTASPVPAAPTGSAPEIMSRPPALDPEAERWASRFETPPPAIEPPPATKPFGYAPPEPPEEAAPKRGGAGRWKTQVMGSMVPLEVSEAREGRRPLSEPPAPEYEPARPVQQAPTPAASTLVLHQVPLGWSPPVDSTSAPVTALRDAILSQGASRHLRVEVTGSADAGKAQIACGLAVALSEAGLRVLLVEADFDQPQVHQVMALAPPTGAGFSQQITARRSEAGQGRPWAVLRCSPTLQALCEGRLRSPGMLASEDFQHAIRQLGDQFHVLIMHSPALERPADLRPVDALAQAAVVVSANDQASIQFGNRPLRDYLR